MSSRNRRSRSGKVAYTSIDEWLDMPRTRILRTLRRFDWIDNEELRAVISVPSDRRAMNAHNQWLSRLVRDGLVQRRRVNSTRHYVTTEYRLTPGVRIDPPALLEPIPDDFYREVNR